MNTQALEQVLIEDRYSRKNIRQHISGVIREEVDKGGVDNFDKACDLIEGYLDKNYYASKNARVEVLRNCLNGNEDFDIAQLVIEILVIVIPMSGAQPIQGAATKLASVLGYEDIYDGIRTAVELLAVVCYSDMYDIIPAKNSDTGSLMLRCDMELPEETLQYIADTKYLPPMIVPPMPVYTNSDNGYLTKQESVLLGNGNHHNKKIALDVINIASKIKLSIDTNMLQHEEVSSKPLDTPEKIVNFNRMKLSSKAVYEDLMAAGNEFYLTHKYDKRGRIYSQGYHLHIQASEYKKSLMCLAKKEVITCG